MILDELVAVLSFDIDDKNLKAFNDKIEEGMKLMVGFSATVVGAGAALFGIAKMTADAGEQAMNMAQKFGISAQAYQELQYAARGEADALAGSMTFLAKSSTAAVAGAKEQSEAYKKLGVNLKDVNGKLKPTDQLIMDIAEGMSKMKDGPEKAGLAMDIFGKAGTELIPFLNKGSASIAQMRNEANELGFVLGEDALNASGDFNDGLADISNMVTGIRNTIGSGLLPIMNKMIGNVAMFIKTNRVLINSRLEKFFQIVGDYAERGWYILTQLWSAVEGLTQVFGGLENVLQAAAIAMSIFAGAKILYTIGTMIQLVQTLGTAFTIANAKALMIPILIGAAVVALGLIIEDIVAFFQGKDSVTGIIVEKFKEMFKWLESAFEGFGGTMKVITTILLTPLRAVINAFQTILDLISLVRGKMSVGDFAKNAGARFMSNLGMGGDGSLKGAMGLSNKFIDSPKAMDGAVGLAKLSNSPTASSAASAVPAKSDFVSNSNAQNNQITIATTVNAGGNANASDIAKQSSSQISQDLNGVLRGAKRQFGKSGGAQ